MVWGGLGWFGGGLGLTWQVNVIKNAFKFLLQLLRLSQKHILGVKKVVWDGLDVVWGGLGCFGVVWGVSTDPFATVGGGGGGGGGVAVVDATIGDFTCF